MSYHKSCGPSVWRDGDDYRGACIRSFSGGVIACIELTSGGTCLADRSNPRGVPGDGEVVPDWCPYFAGMVRDAKMANEFRRLGLDSTKKKDVLEIIRAMPAEYKPKGARDLDLYRLHGAIRSAWDAGWRMGA